MAHLYCLDQSFCCLDQSWKTRRPASTPLSGMQGPVRVSGNPQAYLRHLAPKEQLGSKRGLGDGGPKLHRPTMR
jgi:hypothetical protein